VGFPRLAWWLGVPIILRNSGSTRLVSSCKNELNCNIGVSYSYARTAVPSPSGIRSSRYHESRRCSSLLIPRTRQLYVLTMAA
jgi:hypothetical protein